MCARARSASGISSVTSSTDTASSSSWRSDGSARSSGCRGDAALAVNGDDPQLGRLAGVRPGTLVFGVDDPRLARPSLQHAADSKYCVVCGTPYEYAAAYVGHLGDYRCPACGNARPPLDVVAREIELGGLERVSFSLVTPDGTRRVRLRAPGPLQRLQRTRRRGARAHARRLARRRRRRARALRRSLRPLRANRDRRAAAADAADQEPGGGERGDPDARRGQSSAGRGDRAQRRDRRRQGRVVDLGRRLRAPARGTRARRRDGRSRRGARPALQVRRLSTERIDVLPDLAPGSSEGLRCGGPEDELVVLPTYTAMLALRRLDRRRAAVRPYWERAA